MSKHSGAIRNYIVFGIVAAIAVAVGSRLFLLSYIRHTIYAKTAQAQNENINNLLIRGNIYIQDSTSPGSDGRYLVAVNKKFPLAYVVPSKVTDYQAAITQLHTTLGVETDEIKKILDSGATTTKVVARRITDEQAKTIIDLNMKGVSIQYENDRSYPGGKMLSTVLGFLGYGPKGREGQYGIEAYFNEELTGMTDGASVNAPRPADITLTIDRNIQSLIETKLDEVLKKWHATGGTIIIQDPQTGKILGMADRPGFDPNNYRIANPSNYLNQGVQSVFEPGSSYKPITMAAGLDLDKVSPTTTFTDPGFVEVAGHTIHNFDNQSHGVVSMTTVLEKSLNTGVMFVENLIGDDNFLNYSINFGFGQKTNVDLPGEVNGDITNLYSGRKINDLTASFGQGIAVTPLQLINAYSALANGGKLMKPYVVDHVSYEGGKIQTTQPEVVSIPISEKTSRKIRDMLVSVVDNGFDKARIKGYDIAGKTGTAQIPDGHGGYEENVFIHDFLGFAPASNPKFVVLIKMDRPQGITFAADSLSPTFREIAQYLINYFNIPPTR